MTRRKGKITGRTNERDYPFIVEMPLPEGGFGKKLDAMEAFHREHGVEFHRGRSFRRVGGYVCRWCFADTETAEAFRVKFGGIAFKLKRRLRYGRQKSSITSHSSVSANRKMKRPRGRPRVRSMSINVPMPPDELKALDRWITAKGKGLSRPEAIRQLVRTAVADS